MKFQGRCLLSKPELFDLWWFEFPGRESIDQVAIKEGAEKKFLFFSIFWMVEWENKLEAGLSSFVLIIWGKSLNFMIAAWVHLNLIYLISAEFICWKYFENIDQVAIKKGPEKNCLFFFPIFSKRWAGERVENWFNFLYANYLGEISKFQSCCLLPSPI